VHVVAGPGNNGADGRVAAELLRRAGVRTSISTPSGPVPRCDLVIDAAFGTGLSRDYDPPELPASTPLVLAVDCPSGLDGLTGQPSGSPWRADRTITFGAHKPGLLLGEGPALCGEVLVEPLGLDVSHSRSWLVEPGDEHQLAKNDQSSVHKWQRAGLLFAGSPGMTGAAELAATAAMRSGARFLRVVSPGDALAPIEAVHVSGDLDVPEDIARFGAVAVGPGIGLADRLAEKLVNVLRTAEAPVIVDADALTVLSRIGFESCARRAIPAILTPHDGEFVRLSGGAVGSDRVEAARALAQRANAVVLLKGPTTVISDPDGRTRLIAHGDERLATAGSGDVLTGIMLGMATGGGDPFDIATAAASLHASLVDKLPVRGSVASDLVGNIRMLST
jgi:hydroxyethylthiazole kinase-like uncharacterized protein yjeF